MPTKNNLTNLVAAETEIGNDGVGHSTMQSSQGEVSASPAELTLALEMSQKAIESLKAENERLRANQGSSSDIKLLADLIASAVAPKGPQGPTEAENLNRASDFQKGMQVDGRSLMEVQQTLNQFRDEQKMPISIAKTFQSTFGPYLAVSVLGVRVAIPCDGKTYYINETHWLHARERMAKVDLMAMKQDEVVEMNV